MKKIWLTLIGIVWVLSVSASPFIEGKQYIQLHNMIRSEPQVIEFFSFYCTHCYQFEQVYHISHTIQKVLPAGIKIKKYHVDFLGPMGKQLTKAWVVAMALGKEDTVSPLLFDALHKTNTIHTLDDIRTLFIKAGIDKKEYDSAWNSFFIKSLIIKQEQIMSNLPIRSVPIIFVNNQYLIKHERLDLSSIEAYRKQLEDIVKFLVNKK